MITQGLQVIAENNTSLIDRTERTDKSLFRLGLDWPKYALKKNLNFEPVFWFQLLMYGREKSLKPYFLDHSFVADVNNVVDVCPWLIRLDTQKNIKTIHILRNSNLGCPLCVFVRWRQRNISNIQSLIYAINDAV